ncbi:MAG: pyruvate dehydrogenase (acetyl-transferring) E1 component subunit alpha [Deltaproteobacteria bacterium GWA2_38_16]|nr:MAG: pyruvate dehydrogenase (acetyl-transferring) E1 component subunit alpha [Deltaproteobacteria bacterium GWA2_38_16]OGQ02451.1 MAG: pyruvate dehydrogenase (acetyl-transferring) E1 component subunit alpha [Deltaproteobacteria bacterium RIFCSPHIGHO2_02_FULL_38_15]OGQ34869.1 MAG: pyruvate dehydrogenase (acetyl-transferring) E1 component subunit alpha [Deltaproteobacteria bacterium RIFCSPLOWO2_01_FULL_38_9]OGQ59998.1 MAG: pyruvate dehydrogenase (acetyl-transferring) E1 component subunit alpha 
MEIVQILKPDGTLVNSSLEPKLSQEQLKKLYHYMVLTRLMDERGLMMQRQGKIGFYVTSTGQEAIVGGALALEKDDWVFPAYREHAVGLFLGMPLKIFIAQLFGNSEDANKGRQMPNHFAYAPIHYVSISSPIATQVAQAAGAAMAMKLKKQKTVCITYFGDGGTSENDFHAGMNFAGVYKAPCIFYCSNNQYAISVPVEKQTAQQQISEKAKAYGFPGIRVDGNDVLAVYKVVKDAVDRAKRGEGPTLVESYTFRMGPHSSSDDPTRYCPKSKLDEWAKQDPIKRFKAYLINKKLWSEKEDAALIGKIKQEISDVITEVTQAKPPALSTLFEDVYKEMPLTLQWQKEALLEEAKQKGSFKDSSEAFPL